MSGAVGRPAKPASLHILHGNPSKKPMRELLDEVLRPKVEIPACPAHLGAEARAEWKRLTPHLKQLGLITQIDRAALAAYCAAWGDFVWAEKRIKELNRADENRERGRIWATPSGYKQISVPLQIRNRSLELLAKFLSDFGMSPAARSRVSVSDSQLGPRGIDKPQEGGWGSF